MPTSGAGSPITYRPMVRTSVAERMGRAHRYLVHRAGRGRTTTPRTSSPCLGGGAEGASHHDEIERWSQLERVLRRHEYRLGQAAAYTQPEHTVAALGPLPERMSSVERWHSAAGAIEAYRVRWNVMGIDALGPEPLDPEQRAHWHRAVAAIESSGFASPAGLVGGPDQEWLSSMWNRVHGFEGARPNATCGMASASEPPPLAWNRDVDSGYDLDGGFGL